MPITALSILYMTIFFLLGTLLGVNIALWLDKRKEKQGHTLQEQIQSLDCDITNLRLMQDNLNAKIDRLREGGEVNIHHVHEMDPKAFAEAVDRQLRRSRALGND